jgi:hypothetical protein
VSAPLVTIIVPGHDVAEYADAALASLRTQEMTRWCAILIDDGSTDATAQIFAAAADADPRFRFVAHDEQRGLGAARNTGLDLVDTPLLGFLDADDVLAPGALARLTGTLERTGSDFAVGAYVRLRADAGGTYVPGAVQPWVSAATDPERLGTTVAQHPDVTGNVVAWSKISRREFWDRAGLRFPEDRLYEDQALAQRMYTRARAFDTIPDVVMQWRVRADGSSITQRESALPVLQDCLAAMSEGLEVLEAAGAPRAAAARVRLMLEMDVPRLARIAQDHPDDAYRRAVGAFARALWERGPLPAGALSAASAPAVSAALLW